METLYFYSFALTLSSFRSYFLFSLFLFVASLFCVLIVLPFIWKTFYVVIFEEQPTSWAYHLFMTRSCAFVFTMAEMLLNGQYVTLAVKHRFPFYACFFLHFYLPSINLFMFSFPFLIFWFISLNRTRESRRRKNSVSFPSPAAETLWKGNLPFAEHLLWSFIPKPINLISQKGQDRKSVV